MEAAETDTAATSGTTTPPVEAQWYYVDSAGQQHGPRTAAELRQLHASASLPLDALFCTEGMREWCALAKLPQLAAAIGLEVAAEVKPEAASTKEYYCATASGEQKGPL